MSSGDVSRVSPDFLRRIGDAFAPVKKRTYALMQPATGDAVLDLGCGPGTDTIPLAALVGSEGSVVGIDSDPEMIRVADGRAAAAGCSSVVRHVLADASSLPLEGERYDSCRSERVFQHLLDPERALAELRRVVKPGGTIVVADPDTASMSLDTTETDIAWRLPHSMAGVQNNGYSARGLFRLFRTQGLENVIAEVIPMIFHDYEVLRVLLRVKLDEVLRHAGLSVQDFERLEREIEEASRAQTFFGYVSMVVVAGKKPA